MKNYTILLYISGACEILGLERLRTKFVHSFEEQMRTKTNNHPSTPELAALMAVSDLESVRHADADKYIAPLDY